MDAKFKKLNHELQVKKYEASANKTTNAPEKYEEDDGIEIIDVN